MERIKQALDKARQERQARQGSSPAPESTPRTSTGEIAFDQTRTITVDETLLKENRIVTGLEPGPFTDAYNMLRTQVLQRFKENNWNVLAITSPGPSEGKTLTAINLAISIAREVDYSVLLVDANLRHPWMLEHLGLEQRKGLSDYLVDDAPISELLFRPGRVEHLVVLPGGQPVTDSAEMLNSPRMAKLVEDMKSRYHSRIIIFDLPPVLTSADALAFSPYVDAALLVVEEGVTAKQDVERAVDLLSSTNIVGTVLNKAERDS
ncbi:CpsD/CapB family tyrosine-protein kinase [Crocinitomicaceae bacterium]|nr:CpsD/CapB family tyrosine-protein kinase [Crocinitomicaceae bacterium]